MIIWQVAVYYIYLRFYFVMPLQYTLAYNSVYTISLQDTVYALQDT